MKRDIVTKAISTKVNENLFAQARMMNPTPDTLEFCRLFPVVVEQLLMRMTTLPFIYHTKPSYYEKPDTDFEFCQVPPITKMCGNEICDEDLKLLNDYRKSYLEGVRQLNIRSQMTKDRVGTLPLYAYSTPPPAPKEVDFLTLISQQSTFSPSPLVILFPKGIVIKFHQTQYTSVAVVDKDYHEQDDKLVARVYKANETDPLTLYPGEIISLSKEVRLEPIEGLHVSNRLTNSCISLSEKNYEDIFSAQCDEADDIEPIDHVSVPPVVVGEKRGCRRQSRLPTHLQDFDM